MKEVYPVKIFNTRREQIDYTGDQKKALLAVEFFLKSNFLFFLLSGNAGTGKTTIAENIATYSGATMLAPTNAAVKRLRDKLLSKKISKNRFHTLHSILYGVPDPDTGDFSALKEGGFERKGVYIIDEASMIDEKVLGDIVKEAESKNAKIIFMGDDFQLEPVNKDPHLFEWESAYPDIFNDEQKVKLEEVRRNDGSILKIATHLRKDFPVPQILDVGEVPDFKFVQQKFTNQIVKDIRNDNSFVVLVATNKDRVAYNKAIRKVKYLEDAQKLINDGELIISVANQEFLNGEQYQILEPEIVKSYTTQMNVGSKTSPRIRTLEMHLIKHKVKGYRRLHYTLLIPQLDMPSLHAAQIMTNKDIYNDKQLTDWNKDLFKRTWKSHINIGTYGYSVSVHKSQGNEWDNVYIDCSWLSNAWNKSRWLYTAITRAKSYVELKISRQFKIVNDV